MITHRPASPLSGVDCTDLATKAAITIHEDAQKSQEMARTARREAQEDRIELMHQAADKLREMASNVLGSGFFQGLTGLAATVSSACAGFDYQSLPKDLTLGEKIAAGAEKGFNVLSKVDGFDIQKQYHAVEKQELETSAEVAGNQAQEKGDLEAEARRLKDSASNQLEKMNDARHAATMASIRV